MLPGTDGAIASDICSVLLDPWRWHKEDLCVPAALCRRAGTDFAVDRNLLDLRQKHVLRNMCIGKYYATGIDDDAARGYWLEAA